MSKVSVIIPCYNHGHYLDEAVDSILKQTYQDFEIIIVNDGSTDAFTIEKLRAYHKPKTTVIHTDNGGPSAARNTGIRASHGEFILTLDADDYFETTFLEKAVPILERSSEIGAVACGVQHVGTDTKRHIPRGGDVKSFVIENSALGNALIKKICWEQAGGYDETMRSGGYEDWNFWIDVTKHGWLVHVIPEYLFYYRRHPVSRRTKSHENRPEFILQVVKNHHDLFAQYVEEVIFAKEQKIQSLRQEKHALLNSRSYKIGNLLFSPIRAIKKLLHYSCYP